ncbi:MAG: cysteine peptidase family C39 domain-containing protein [Phycisphaerae bacterium]
MVPAIAVIVLFLLGLVVSRRMGRGSWWWVPFAGSLAVVSLVMVGHRSMGLSVVAPFSWLIAPDVSPYLMAFTIPLLLSTLIVRLRQPRKKAMVTVFMLFMGCAYSLLPVACPALARASLLSTPTRFDAHGVCLQSHGYTCGPASAVTCLRTLGISCEEGPLAAAARSGPLVGTDPLLLERAINNSAAGTSVRCGYRVATSLEGVRTPFIATMWIPHVGGHYVAVLDVSKNKVIVGDPLDGRCVWDRRDFENDWRGGVHEFTCRPRLP